MKVESHRPKIFEYLDYREFLKALIEYLRNNENFTIRAFSEEVGMSSSGHLSLILNGTRNLTEAKALSFSSFFGFGAEETEFFLALIKFNQAKTYSQQQIALKEVLRQKKMQGYQTISMEQFEKVSTWYSLVLLESLPTKWGAKTIEEMAQDLGIQPVEVSESIEALQSVGLLEKSGDEWFVSNSSLISTSLAEHMGRALHLQLMERARAEVEHGDIETRAIGSLTIALSKKRYKELSKKLFEFNKELNVEFSNDDDPDDIYQLSYELIPALRLKEPED